MASNADRTLVKSPPELWELVDDAELMQRWCALLVGRGDPVTITVTEQVSGERIAWRTSEAGAVAEIELRLAEKGFGTKVVITASCEREVPGDMLESLLDELGSPQRRPFARA